LRNLIFTVNFTVKPEGLRCHAGFRPVRSWTSFRGLSRTTEKIPFNRNFWWLISATAHGLQEVRDGQQETVRDYAWHRESVLLNLDVFYSDKALWPTGGEADRRFFSSLDLA
jgi:hypothetical protein